MSSAPALVLSGVLAFAFAALPAKGGGILLSPETPPSPPAYNDRPCSAYYGYSCCYYDECDNVAPTPAPKPPKPAPRPKPKPAPPPPPPPPPPDPPKPPQPPAPPPIVVVPAPPPPVAPTPESYSWILILVIIGLLVALILCLLNRRRNFKPQEVNNIMADISTSDQTLAKLVEAMVALNANVQSATQTSQQINQAVSDMLTKLSSQVSTTSTVTQNIQEETGFGERFQVNNVDRSDAWFANVKRSYDEYQETALSTIRQGQRYAEKVLSDAQTFDNQRQNIATQALVNAVETANMVGKQAVRHSDVAIDRQWNVDEQNTAVASIWNNETFKEAIRGAVAAAVAESMKKTS